MGSKHELSTSTTTMNSSRVLLPSAVDLGVRDVPDDQKVNLGACLLRTALSKWAHEFSRLYMSGAPLPGLDDPGADQLPHFSDQLPPAGMANVLLRVLQRFLIVFTYAGRAATIAVAS
jgi:hypothetical protein